MQKIGLNNCTDVNLKFHKKIFDKKTINALNLNISKISSCSIDCKIIKKDFLETSSCLKIFLKLQIKIMYLKNDDDNTYSHNENIFILKYIDIDRFIDGCKVNNVFLESKTSLDIYIENIDCTITKNNLLIFTYFLIINLKISPSFYLGYQMENGLSNNLFLSYCNGDNLIQKTFDNFLQYKNIIYESNSSKLLFIGYNDTQSMLYYSDSKFKSPVKSISNLNNINSFCIENKNKLIISMNQGNNSFLFNFDFNTNKLTRINIPTIGTNYYLPYYDKSKRKTYCLVTINNTNSLCCIDSNNNINKISNCYNVLDYKTHHTIDKIILKVTENNKDNICLYYKDQNNLIPLNINIEYDEILKFDFYKDEFSDYILILFKYNDLNYLISYDLNTLQILYLYENYYINDFIVDKITYDLFIAYKKDMYNYVAKINNFLEESIVSTSNNIKSIFLRENF